VQDLIGRGAGLRRLPSAPVGEPRLWRQLPDGGVVFLGGVLVDQRGAEGPRRAISSLVDALGGGDGPGEVA
jgi:hypothetical protein